MADYPKRNIGRKRWAISGGRIPLQSTGEEPLFTSRDMLTILNTRGIDCDLELMVCFEEKPLLGPYKLTVKAQRMRRISFNNLIDPLPIPLDTPFACTIHATVEVVIQFTRIDTSSPTNAITGTLAYGING